MLSWIVNFLESLWSIITSIISFIFDGIMAIINLLGLIPTYLTYLADIISITPSFLLPFLAGIIAITVIWTFKKAV